MDDSALVEGLRCRDPVAVRYLSETCLPAVWRFACVRAKADRHLAEDFVSEAVLALLKAVADPTITIQSPMSWLRTVVANKVVDHFRAAARVQHLIDQVKVTQPHTDARTAAEQQQVLEQREEVREILESLPEQTRIALEWKYIDKASVREISDRMGLSEKAVESILFRGRREFRERMLRQQKSEDREGPVAPGSVSHGPVEGDLLAWDQHGRTVVPNN